MSSRALRGGDRERKRKKENIVKGYGLVGPMREVKKVVAAGPKEGKEEGRKRPLGLGN
jgi:hypothetical protein